MQILATVVAGIAVPDDVLVDDGFAAEPLEGGGLGVGAPVEALPRLAPGAGLAPARGAGIEVGAALQVLTNVVTGTGFGVGVTFPIGAAVPPLDTAAAGLADGADPPAEVAGAWLGFVIVDWPGFTGVVWLGGLILL